MKTSNPSISCRSCAINPRYCGIINKIIMVEGYLSKI